MARIFLSYDRDDADRARPIALALEKAGHSVWWDPHIKAGEQYTKVIDEALQAADAVVVLWSAHSIESTWVRDEAAVGRDKGRLVPILIDAISPPLGFRQFQNIDMSRWRGRGRTRQWHEVADALETLTGEKSPQRIESARRFRIPLSRIVAGLTVALALMAAAYFLLRERRDASVQTVAVVAAAPAAEPLAQDLLVKLTTLQSANSGSMRLIGAEQSANRKADLVFQVSTDGNTETPAASLLLLAGKDKSVLWSEDFKQESGNLGDLKQRTSFTAARVLGCALDGFSSRAAPLKPAVLKSYLNACALLDETFFDDTSHAVAMLQQVAKDAPGFKPGWAKLLIAETNRYQGLSETDKKAYAPQFRQLIASARQLDPDIPEAYVAELELLPGRDFYGEVRLINRAAKTDPNNVFVLAARSLVMLLVGRMDAAVEDARHAASLDPLSPAIRSAYLQALIYSGRTDAARSELAEAERLWPDATTIVDSRLRLGLRYGNLTEAADALKLIRSGKIAASRMTEAFVRARINPTKANVDRAVELAMSAYQSRHGFEELSELIITLGEFDRTGELLGILLSTNVESQYPYFVELLFRQPLADLRADPRFMQVAAHLGLLDYWRRSGDWPDFCSDPALPYDCKKVAARLGA
jgi:tetratricopeptide (TPR) repeat protein